MTYNQNILEENNIKVTEHPVHPLSILNYTPMSPKTKFRECRGLVVDTDNNVIARPFKRFFNWAETGNEEFTNFIKIEMKNFNLNDFTAMSKEDGSLVILYHFDGSWHTNTRNNFASALDTKLNAEITWFDAIKKAFKVDSLSDLNKCNLDTDFTYLFELVGPNKIIRMYPETQAYLLSAFHAKEDIEMSNTELDKVASKLGVVRPEQRHFSGVDEIHLHLNKLSKTDPTFEGYVIRDNSGSRFKIKSPSYFELHSLWGNGEFTAKRLIPFILKNEGDELLTYFPEVKPRYDEYKEKIESEYDNLKSIWKENWQIKDQKEFALSILNKTDFHAILFSLRSREGKNQTEESLKEMWESYSDLIVRKIGS